MHRRSFLTLLMLAPIAAPAAVKAAMSGPARSNVYGGVTVDWLATKARVDRVLTVAAMSAKEFRFYALDGWRAARGKETKNGTMFPTF